MSNFLSSNIETIDVVLLAWTDDQRIYFIYLFTFVIVALYMCIPLQTPANFHTNLFNGWLFITRQAIEHLCIIASTLPWYVIFMKTNRYRSL